MCAQSICREFRSEHSPRRSALVRASLAACAFLALGLCGCAASRVAPLELQSPPRTDAIVVGVASYYGDEFQGKKTASGERYDRREFTAAHAWLPFGTRVRVTNLENQRSVIVRINDRGPHRRGRILDVSRAAAKRLGLIGPGTARVRLEVLDRGDEVSVSDD